MDHIGIDVHKLPMSGLPRPPGARFLGGWEGADMTPLLLVRPLQRPLDRGHYLGCSVGEEVGDDGHGGDRDPADYRKSNSDRHVRLSWPSAVPRRRYAEMARPSILGAPAARRRVGTCRDSR
jgi:hypothetical protein